MAHSPAALRCCLSNDVYYVNARINGTLNQECLNTTDPAVAKRKLADLKGSSNRRSGTITFEDLAKRYMTTRTGVAQSTREKDEWAIMRMRKEAPFFKELVYKIKPSEYAAFRAGMNLGYGINIRRVYPKIIEAHNAFKELYLNDQILPSPEELRQKRKDLTRKQSSKKRKMSKRRLKTHSARNDRGKDTTASLNERRALSSVR